MTSTLCPTCSGELLTSAGQTFCPACLMQEGLKRSTANGQRNRVAWEPPTVETLAAAFPQLDIQTLLGQGGMGAVYRVRQKELDRIAALKVLPGEMATEPGFAERFLREARLLASLSHPHIVTVYEFGQREGVYFLLMEFVDGVTLRQAMQAEPVRRLAPHDALAVVGQLCDALQFAHDEGVVHRDIKPENILIDKRGRVKIADFGLARLLNHSPLLPSLTGTNQLLGTPVYMAPEQIEGLAVIDHRADIYSLGVVFYELLTGELPLGRFAPPSQKSNVDLRLDEVVLRTLAKEPERRYQQASQIKTDVQAVHSLSDTTSGKVSRRIARWGITRTTVGFLAGVVATVLLIVGAAVWLESDSIAEWREWRTATTRDTKPESVSTAMDAADPYIAVKGDEFVADAASVEPPGMMSSMRGAGGEATSGPQPQIKIPITMTENGFEFDGALIGLSEETASKIREILTAAREEYLKVEAKHLDRTVNASGAQVITIRPFPDEVKRIENALWTRLDDAVPIETQKLLRDWLRLYGEILIPESVTLGGMGGHSGGVMFASGMGGIVLAESNEPGLLGWSPTDVPRQITIGRSGRWFEWTVTDRDGEVRTLPSGPELEVKLRRFYREPGPWLAVAEFKTALEANDFDAALQHFTPLGLLTMTLKIKEPLETWLSPLSFEESRSVQSAEVKIRQTSKSLARIVSDTESDPNAATTADAIAAVPGRLLTVGSADAELRIRDSALAVSSPTQKHAAAVVLMKAMVYSQKGLPGLRDPGFLDQISKLPIEESGDTAICVIPGDDPIPVRFIRKDDRWLIDWIGDPKKQHGQLVANHFDWPVIGSISLACSGVINDDRPISNFITDEHRDEWIGELLVAVIGNQSTDVVRSRIVHSSPTVPPRDVAGYDALPIVIAMGTASEAAGVDVQQLIGKLKEPEYAVLNSAATLSDVRRAACIRLVENIPDRDKLLIQLLTMRQGMQLPSVIRSFQLKVLNAQPSPGETVEFWTATLSQTGPQSQPTQTPVLFIRSHRSDSCSVTDPATNNDSDDEPIFRLDTLIDPLLTDWKPAVADGP